MTEVAAEQEALNVIDSALKQIGKSLADYGLPELEEAPPAEEVDVLQRKGLLRHREGAQCKRLRRQSCRDPYRTGSLR